MAFVSVEWLAEHVQVPAGLTLRQLADDLVRVGLEEEAIHPPKVSGDLVAGRVRTLDAKEQNNGKVINYCRVDVGAYNDAPGTGKEPADIPSRGIICGAHNFGVDDLVVVALPGTVLPGGFEITPRKTYGHISDGMICSERELGIGDDHSGILVLNNKFPADQIPAPGESVLALLGLDSELLEINITPDRGYCFSMRGVAREYSHSTGAVFTDPAALSAPAPTDDGFPVRVNDDAPIRGNVGCDRFVTRVVTGVNPLAATPEWMVRRLEVSGMRSISLAVDVTNYVMMDLGQPLHAYDADKLDGAITVRRARAGEQLVTLDNQERILDPEDLLITDGENGSRVIGLAGVMGGASTEVDEGTNNIVVEAAHFDPVSIARTARRHKLPSEASRRFERGVDSQLAPAAAQRVVDLLVEYGGGSDTGQVTDFNRIEQARPIAMDWHTPEAIIGVPYTREQVCETLRMIGCDVTETGDLLQVVPPSWRPDLVGSAHLVEEIARILGYDQIPDIVPVVPPRRSADNHRLLREDAARSLAEHGWTEVLSYPFVPEDVFTRQLLGDDDARTRAIRIANPLADNEPLLRTSVLDSLLSVAARNIARGNTDLAIFEAGLVFRASVKGLSGIPPVASRPSDEQLRGLLGGVPKQPHHIAGIGCGNFVEQTPLGAARQIDWRDAVSAVRDIATAIGSQIRVVGSGYGNTDSPLAITGPESVAPFHPGRCARVLTGAKLVAVAGELHPDVCDAFALPQRSVAFEVDLDALIKSRRGGGFAIKPVSTYPPAREDLAFVVDDSVSAQEAIELIEKQAGELLETVRLFDSYTGEQIPAGKKSLAFALQLRAVDHTLAADEIAEVRNRVVKLMAKKLRAELRS
ncbi:MAG: phenylalanine--tRNA ligase subunit beta [Varibaculum sp.]|nr:phenylalanine--tRNA ligase subunit beta [Varibaculum sp.]